MSKILVWIGLIVVIITASFFTFNAYVYDEKMSNGLPTNYREVAFTISGTPMTINTSSISYFGNEVVHDIDGDDADDTAFLITQETASSTRYFLVGALKRDGGYIGTKAVLLGENISPQTTEKGEGRQIIVNYAVKYPDTATSTGKSIWLLLDIKTLEFGEVVQNFEGESRD